MRNRLTLQEAYMRLEGDGRTWAVRPELLQLLSQTGPGGPLSWLPQMSTEQVADLEAKAKAASSRSTVGAASVIPLKGMLMPQVSFLAQLFGLGSSLTQFRQELKAAAADPDVGTIVLDIDSPGGVVDLIPETAADIRQAKQSKPIVAVANTLSASAAYWLGSQAHEFVASPSAEVGSIGVYQIHFDESDAWAAEGIKPSIIKAGKYKIEGNPYEKLSDEARTAMQQGVDDYYSLFTRDVARGRNASVTDVREGYGEGRVLTAKRAQQANLVDRVDTLEGTLSRIAKGDGPSRGSSNSSEEQERETQAANDALDAEGEIEYSPEERNRLLDVLARVR